MRRLIMLCGVLFLAQLALADTTDVIIGNQQVGNTIPFWGSGFGAHRFQTVFLQSDINRAGRIIKFSFMPETIFNPTYNNLRFYFCQTNRSNDISATFNDNYDGNTPLLMFDSASCTFNVSANQWLEFPVDFDYNNVDNLLLEIRWRGSSGHNTYLWSYYIQNSEKYRVFNLGSDSAATGSADYVRYYVKLTIEGVTGTDEVVIGERSGYPAMSVLPNPTRINEGVRIVLNGLPKDRAAGLQIYDMNGRLVRSLAVDRAMTTAWDLKNEQGRAVATGVYMIRCGPVIGRVVVVE
jgi:hypothetical protein